MIVAIVVLYNPSPECVACLLSSIVPQVAVVVAVDNTPHSGIEPPPFIRDFANHVLYMPLGINKGIAEAQNVGIEKALSLGCSYVLLLDQDSVPPPMLIESLVRAERQLSDKGVAVAAVGPLFIDRKTRMFSYAIRYGWFCAKKIPVTSSGPDPVEADWLIASGSLISSSVIRKIGPMRADLFIDWVDAEWGLRAKHRGLRSFVVPDAVMEHSVGDSSKNLLRYSFNLHSDVRNYYIVRNATYLLRPKMMGWRWVTAMVLRIPKYIAIHTLYSGNRLHRLKLMLRAGLDGARGRLGPIAN